MGGVGGRNSGSEAAPIFRLGLVWRTALLGQLPRLDSRCDGGRAGVHGGVTSSAIALAMRLRFSVLRYRDGGD